MKFSRCYLRNTRYCVLVQTFCNYLVNFMWSLRTSTKTYYAKHEYNSLSFHNLEGNGLQLGEGGDFEALHCQPSTNFDRSTKLDLTAEPPLLGRCCYAFAFSFKFKFVSHHSHILPTMNTASTMKNSSLFA